MIRPKKRVDRFLDLMEEFKNIADVAAGAYINQVNFAIDNADDNSNSKENTGGEYTKSPEQPFGLIDRKSS